MQEKQSPETTSTLQTTKTTKPNNKKNKNEVLNLERPPPLIISYYLLNNCKLWVWDFDDTLIDSSIYMNTNMTTDAIHKRTDKQLDKEFPQWRYFKKLVNYLIMHGKYVGIASFGTYEIIKAYMDRVMGFNQQAFNRKNIIAPCYKDRDPRTFKTPQNKNEYIYTLMRIYRVEDFKNVVLFDDMPSNVSQATAIGVIGIQIATPRNGDSANLYFGPWIMTDFDKRIEGDCGKEIYLNRRFTGVSNKLSGGDEDMIPYLSRAYDKIDFGTGVQEKFAPMAFGTGIGSRKVSIKPEYRWNKMNVAEPPDWHNGNWQDSSLGGQPISFWDNHHSFGDYVEEDGKTIYQNVKPYGSGRLSGNGSGGTGSLGVSDIGGYDEQSIDIDEGFASGGNGESGKKIEKFGNRNSNTCKPVKMDWIVLLLVIILAIMAYFMIRL